MAKMRPCLACGRDVPSPRKVCADAACQADRRRALRKVALERQVLHPPPRARKLAQEWHRGRMSKPMALRQGRQLGLPKAVTERALYLAMLEIRP